MHCLERIICLNSATNPPPHPLYWHPRIAALRHSLGSLSIDEKYRARLRATLYRHAEDFAERPFYKPGEGWDGLEALQQAALADALEGSLRAMADNYGRIGLPALHKIPDTLATDSRKTSKILRMDNLL